jgi:hypothetical protein
MPFSIYNPLLAAEQDRMQDLFRAFRAAQAREGTGQMIYVLLVCVVAAAAVLLLVQLIRSRRRRTGRADPWSLFLELCRAHKLNWRQRWLLWRLARLEQLSHPARLFLEPEWYAAGGLPCELRHSSAQLNAIRARLFADAKEITSAPDNRQTGKGESGQPAGAALPALKTAPDLDIAPWQASTLPLPLPPVSNTSDGQPV